MIKTNYKQFLLEKFSDNVLKYYMFDYDDNILVMPTPIHVDYLVNDKWTPIDISTLKFAEIRTEIAKSAVGEKSSWRLRNATYDDTYSEFRDVGPRGDNAFIEDTLKSIKTNSFGPVWDKFIQCLVNGNIFMIITARGHEPPTIKSAMNWIIFNCLTKDQKDEMEQNLREFNKLFGLDDKTWTFKDLVGVYLNMCDFIGITSKYFNKKFNTSGPVYKPEKYKAMAIRYFTEKIHNFGKQVNKKVKVGFSDDDTLTAQHVYKYMRDELSLDFPIDYHVYHTKDGIKEL